ncbi:armadillo-type protein [Cladochytrium replicatum]|nr:armadillo-type protein [Cladochytrium replicatum]
MATSCQIDSLADALQLVVPSVTSQSATWKSRATLIDAIHEKVSLIHGEETLQEAKPHIPNLLQCLVSLLDEPHFKVSLTTLTVFRQVIEKFTTSIYPHVDSILPHLIQKLADIKSAIRRATALVIVQIMREVAPDPKIILANCFRELSKHHNNTNTDANIREEIVNIVSTALLTFPTYELDVPALVADLTTLLLDPKSRVRYVTVEAYAIIARYCISSERLIVTLGEYGVDEDALELLRFRFSDAMVPRLGFDGVVEHVLSQSHAPATPLNFKAGGESISAPWNDFAAARRTFSSLGPPSLLPFPKKTASLTPTRLPPPQPPSSRQLRYVSKSAPMAIERAAGYTEDGEEHRQHRSSEQPTRLPIPSLHAFRPFHSAGMRIEGAGGDDGGGESENRESPGRQVSEPRRTSRLASIPQSPKVGYTLLAHSSPLPHITAPKSTVAAQIKYEDQESAVPTRRAIRNGESSSEMVDRRTRQKSENHKSTHSNNKEEGYPPPDNSPRANDRRGKSLVDSPPHYDPTSPTNQVQVAPNEFRPVSRAIRPLKVDISGSDHVQPSAFEFLNDEDLVNNAPDGHPVQSLRGPQPLSRATLRRMEAKRSSAHIQESGLAHLGSQNTPVSPPEKSDPLDTEIIPRPARPRGIPPRQTKQSDPPDTIESSSPSQLPSPRKQSQSTSSLAPQSTKQSLQTIQQSVQILRAGAAEWEEKCTALNEILKAVSQPATAAALYASFPNSSNPTSPPSSTPVPTANKHELLLQTILPTVVSELQNLRSTVAKAAVQTIGGLYASLPRGTLDGSIDITVPALLKKIGEGNNFIVSEIDRVLGVVAGNTLAAARMVGVLVNHADHKSPLIQAKAASLLEKVLGGMNDAQLARYVQVPTRGASMLSTDGAEKVIPALAMLVRQRHAETRKAAKGILMVLAKFPDFERVLDRTLSPAYAKDVRDALATKNGRNS